MIDQDLKQALLDQHNYKKSIGYYVNKNNVEIIGNYDRYSSGKLVQEGDVILKIFVLSEENIDIEDGFEDCILLRIDEVEEYSKKYLLLCKTVFEIIYVTENPII